MTRPRMRCQECGAIVTASTAGAIVHNDPPQAWCLPCWDGVPAVHLAYGLYQIHPEPH